MSNLRLSDLVKVSNDSKITDNIYKILNEKFSEEEKREFEVWLRIVEVNTDQQIRKIQPNLGKVNLYVKH